MSDQKISKIVGRYWGRKAGEIARGYILSLSRENEILLDPFAGSGSVIAAALNLKRRAIYNDLNPVASIIAKGNLIGKETKVRLSKRYLDLYMIDYQGERREVCYYIWEGDRIVKAKLVSGELIDCQGKDYEGEIPYPYPKDPLYYPNGKPFDKKRQVDRVDELFTRRNLLILSEILSEIPKDEKALAAFISILYQSSKMARLNAGSWGVPCYWIPYRRVERNPYLLFERASRRINKMGGKWKEGNVEEVFKGEADVAFLNADAKNLPIPDSSVDLVVTDPPFFDEVQYFELSYLAATWLRIRLDFNNEIVVNHRRGKDEKTYLEELEKAVKEIHRVLKKDKYAIIMFHEESEEKLKKIWDIISSFFKILKEDITIMKQRNIGDRDNLKGKELRIIIAKK